MLTVGSLFSGIGGIDLGFERAGFEIRWQVEIDDYCRKVLAKHWPDVKRYEDVRDVGAHNLERVDVIVGGFPCQPVSVAGRRLGQADARWLWPEFARIVCQIRPVYAVLENVPGLFSRGFADVLRDLAEQRYDAEWCLLSAAQFGAPHLRERAFLIAHAGSVACGGSRYFNRRNDFPRNSEWGAAQGITSGNRWKRWLAETCQDLDRQTNNPWFSRVDDGLPRGLDRKRIRALGNAVVPQVAEYVARCVMEHAQVCDDGR
jgi:DNA (cytosine-5)-methyltransferase 1